MLFKPNLKINFYLFKNLMLPKAKLKPLLKTKRIKERKLNLKYLYKKIFQLETLKNLPNSDKIKPLYMDKYKELWLPVEIYNLT